MTNTANSQQFQINGTWQVDWEQTVNEMSLSDKELYDGLLEEQRLKLESNFSSRRMVFSEDEITITYQSNGIAQQAVGTWSLVDNSELHLIISGRTSKYQVLSNTEQRLVLNNVLAASKLLPKCLVLVKVQ
jgi:hypothetical protein